MKQKTRIQLFASLAVLTLVTTACLGSSDEAAEGDDVPFVAETSGDSSSDSDEDVGSETTDATAPETDSPEGSTEPDESNTDDEAESGGECIVGDWVIDQAEMQGYYNALAANAGGLDMTFAIDGQTLMSFTDDGTLTYVPAFTLQLETGGIAGDGIAGGQLTGTYALEDGLITTEITDNGLTIEVTVSGITMTEAEFGDAFSSIPIASAPYHCTDEGPVIEFQTGGPAHLVQLKHS